MSKAKGKVAATDKTGTPKTDGNKLALHAKDEADRKIAVADAITSTSLNSALIVVGYNAGNTIDLMAAMDVLAEHQKEIKAGDMSRAESMLMNQAVALQSIFVDLALRAKGQTGLPQLQTLTGLALKAQSGCRATLQALGELKYPRQATFVKQANIAHGPQQVNNGTAAGDNLPISAQAHSRAEEIKPQQNELLEDARHGSTQMDTRATPAPARSNPAVAALEPVHRAAKRRG